MGLSSNKNLIKYNKKSAGRNDDVNQSFLPAFCVLVNVSGIE